MLSRWYAIFLGILLLVVGIAGLIAPRVFGFGTGALVTTSVIWLITAVVSLWYGFGVRNASSLRWFSIIVGGLYLLWGIIQLASSPSVGSVAGASLLASLSGLLVLLGAFGLAAGLVPMTVPMERTTMLPGSA